MKRYLFVFLVAIQLFGQSNSGGLRLKVVDPAGLGLRSSVSLVSEANQFRQTYSTDDAGNLAARNLPFGIYRLEIKRPGFAVSSKVVEVRSAIPADVRIQLSVAPAQTAVDVSDSDTLVDPHRTGDNQPYRGGHDGTSKHFIARPLHHRPGELAAGLVTRVERSVASARLGIADSICGRRSAANRQPFAVICP